MVSGWVADLGRALVVLACCSSAAAQVEQVRFSHLSRQGGLSNDSVTSLIQDRSGFIWIGTQHGLNRWDGYGMTVFKVDPDRPGALPGNGVHELLEDRAGRLWVGLRDEGLALFDRSTERFFGYRHDPDNPSSLAHDRVYALAEDGAGTLWVGTKEGLCALQLAPGAPPPEASIRCFHHRKDDPASLTHDRIAALLVDSTNSLWIGTRGGLDRLDLSGRADWEAALRFEHHRHDPDRPDSLHDDEVYALLEDSDGDLWIGTWGGGGLGRLRRGQRAENPPRFDRLPQDDGGPHGPSGDVIWSLLEDQAGDIWVGSTTAGLSRIPATERSSDRPRFRHFRADPVDPFALADDGVFALLIDAQGTLRVGTSHGVSSWNRAPTLLYRHHPADPNSLAGGLRAIVESRSGAVFVATAAGLDELRPRSSPLAPLEVIHHRHDPADPTTLNSDRAYSLLEDRRGRLWVGTIGGGLNVRLPGDPRWYHCPSEPEVPGALHNHAILTLYEDRSGGIHAGSYSGLYVLTDDTPGAMRWRAYRKDAQAPASLHSESISALLEDSDGRLWVGTYEGLHRLRADGGFDRFLADPTDPTRLRNGGIQALYEDPSGSLWVGTSGGGLARFDRATGQVTRTYRERDGIPSADIMGILPDPAGRLWLPTANGLARLDPSTDQVRLFDAADGFPAELTPGAAHVGASGRYYLGSGTGLYVFRPEELNRNRPSPALHLTDFLLANQPVAPGPGAVLTSHVGQLPDIVLEHTDDLFAFEFAALDFDDPAQVRYLYRMEGYDHDWIRTDWRNRRATYTRLPPGSYQFRVRAEAVGGDWPAVETRIGLLMLPPWWQTWWFRSGLALLLIGAPFGWMQRRHRVLQDRRRELEEQVASRTRELVLQTETITAQKEEIAAQAGLLEEQNEVLRDNVRLREEVDRISRHDLKTPLNSVISIAQLLREGGAVHGDSAEMLEVVERAGYRIMNMVNLSLDLFKMEKGSYRFHPSPVDLVEVVDRVRFDLEGHARTKGVPIVLRRDDGTAERTPLRVWADELLSYSMLANLTKNAVEAAPEGTPVTIGLCPIGPEASLSIHNGGAVPEAVRANFFGKYSTAGKGTGTGLGTYSARLMAETQGGRIAMTTSETGGTTVTVTLPALSPAELAAEPARNVPTQPAGVARVAGARAAAAVGITAPTRILIVDDDDANRMVLSHYLPQPPVVVATAINGREAIDRVPLFDPDVIIMDMEMPVMNGLEATAAIRQLERDSARKRATILALSSNDDEASRQRFAAAGCDRYLQKPARRDEILELLRAAQGPQPIASAPGEPVGAVAGGAVVGGARAEAAEADAAGSPLVLVDPDLLPLVPSFLDAKRGELDQLDLAIQADDRQAVRRLGHKLRGSFTMYGFAAAGEMAHRIELGADTGAAPDLNRWCEALREHIGVVEFQSRPGPAPAAETR